MTNDEIVKQSKNAYKQWCEQWRANAKFHKGMATKSFEDFRNIGIGKAVLLVANGYSFEENIETIKKYSHNVDIVACDKTLGHLLRHGINPTYCIVCDANVSYEKYMKPYQDQLDQTILFQNVCGNTEWTKNGNWKDKYFYVNKDVMNYEKEFSALSGCKNFVTAGTNVSNMMVVILTQADNERRQNLFAYDKILLIGFDYSWKYNGKYYAFDQEANGKTFYMRHIYGISPSGEMIFTSNNLSASNSWLKTYVDVFKLNTVQCGKDALSPIGRMGNLEDHIQYKHKPTDAKAVREMLKTKLGIEAQLNKINNGLRDIARDHWYASQSV